VVALLLVRPGSWSLSRSVSLVQTIKVLSNMINGSEYDQCHRSEYENMIDKYYQSTIKVLSKYYQSASESSAATLHHPPWKYIWSTYLCSDAGVSNHVSLQHLIIIRMRCSIFVHGGDVCGVPLVHGGDVCFWSN
jgi:hypothetical protein